MTSRFPYPLEKGDKLRAYYQIKELSKDFDVYLLALSDIDVDQKSIDALSEFCVQINYFRLKKWNIYLQVILYFILGKSIQIGYFYNVKTARKINGLLAEIEPDHIYTQLIRCCEYTKNYHKCPKTLDYMDALSMGFKRRAEKEPFYTKWIFELEAKRLQYYERRIFDYFDYKTIISEQDKKLIFHPDQQEILAIPNGIDFSFFNFPKKEKPIYNLGFIGNMNYPPNIDAVLYLHDNYLQNHPEVSFLIAGATPHSKVLELGKRTNIHVAGWIEDIREAYASVEIFVAPMQIGTGMQNKLLEAMAMGLPCVTTRLANNAIGATHKEHIWVIENKFELQEAIDYLMNHPVEAQQMGGKGQKWVMEKYSWKNATSTLNQLIQPT